jgi:hypothetical protein
MKEWLENPRNKTIVLIVCPIIMIGAIVLVLFTLGIIGPKAAPDQEVVAPPVASPLPPRPPKPAAKPEKKEAAKEPAKPGKPAETAAKPGAPSKPGQPAKPGAAQVAAKPGSPAAKPGAPGVKPGAKPGVPVAAKPGAPGAKPGAKPPVKVAAKPAPPKPAAPKPATPVAKLPSFLAPAPAAPRGDPFKPYKNIALINAMAHPHLPTLPSVQIAQILPAVPPAIGGPVVQVPDVQNPNAPPVPAAVADAVPISLPWKVAGIMMGAGITAIVMNGDQSAVLQPGDSLPDNSAQVVSISESGVTVRTTGAVKREIKLQSTSDANSNGPAPPNNPQPFPQ